MATEIGIKASPAPGIRCLVKATPLNNSNAFWTPYIGTKGHVAKVSEDAKITVVMDDGNVCEGINPDRFVFWHELPSTGSWWKRGLFFLRRTLFFWR